MLKSGESLFRDAVLLDYDFQPKIIPFREQEQRQFALAIKPLLQNQTGRNVFAYGAPGVGKTTACRHVLRELEEERDDIHCFYINCWKENTTFRIFMKICEDLGYKFIQQKKTSELFQLIQQKVNKKGAVFVFDEIDKLEEMDFLYTILEDIYRKSIVLITNYRDCYGDFDERIRSRLNPEFVSFRPYNEQEITAILQQRRELAFIPDCWEEEAFREIVERCTELNDLRIGLYLMREAGHIAEDKSSRRISAEQVALALHKAADFHIKPKEGMEEDLQHILSLVKGRTGSKMGEIFSVLVEQGKEMSYKSFQRRINRLTEDRFITTEKVSGKEGNTTILHYSGERKLTEF